MSKDPLEDIKKKLDEISLNMEKMKVAEYVELLKNPRRLFFINFFAGLARGFGMAVGFTLLGALALYFLKQLVVLNLPLIGDFIAEIVRIVTQQL